MKLRFANYRRPLLAPPADWTASDRAQIDDIVQKESLEAYMEDLQANGLPDDPDELEDLREEFNLVYDEVVDVIDEANTTRFQIHFFDYGTAYLFEAGTTNELGGGSQHSFELNDPDPALMQALGDAYAAADPKIEQAMSFKNG